MFSWSLCLSIESLQEIGEPLQPDAVRSFDQDQGLRYGMFPELCGQCLLRRVESRVGGSGFQTAVSLCEMRSDQQDTGIGNFGGEEMIWRCSASDQSPSSSISPRISIFRVQLSSGSCRKLTSDACMLEGLAL